MFVPLQPLTKVRAFSSAGLEHLPYKQRVGGSNPSTPTRMVSCSSFLGYGDFFFVSHLLNDKNKSARIFELTA